VPVGSQRWRAVFAAIGALAAADELPGQIDFDTGFAPGRAYVRRVPGYSVWILYRFDDAHVSILQARDEEPSRLDG
jgi:hypothetical protein